MELVNIASKVDKEMLPLYFHKNNNSKYFLNF